MLDARNVVIGVLLAALVWFGATIVRLENYRYGASLGMCEQYALPEHYLEREACRDQTETRTSPVFHLLFALGLMHDTPLQTPRGQKTAL